MIGPHCVACYRSDTTVCSCDCHHQGQPTEHKRDEAWEIAERWTRGVSGYRAVVVSKCAAEIRAHTQWAVDEALRQIALTVDAYVVDQATRDRLFDRVRSLKGGK